MTIQVMAKPKNFAKTHAKDHIKNQWLANLTIEFSMTENGTTLTRTQRNGPLSVQKAFYPQGRDCAHIYLLHPPAGIVSGDQLHVDILLNQDAHCLVTTPGANRFYRAREDLTIGDSKQSQTTYLSLEKNAKCENFPQETIVYEGAHGVNVVDVHLTSSSVYLGWDITCLGLPSSDEPFALGKYCQLNKVTCDDTLIYHDRIAISHDNQLLNHSAGLNGDTVFATFLAYAPLALVSNNLSVRLVEELRELLIAEQADHLISISQVKQLLIIRYLGLQAQQCKNLFVQMWQHLRPHYLAKSGVVPRIWHT